MLRTISFLSLPALLLAACPTARSATFTVGSDAACTHSNILTAISAASSNGPGMDEVRIAMNQTYVNQTLPVVGHSVSILGGFAHCGTAGVTGRTVIGGIAAGTSGTISTSGTGATAFTLSVRNIELRDGGNLTGRRGGAVRIEGRFNVTLGNVRIADNLAGRGGGIYVDGSDGVVLNLESGTTLVDNVSGVSGGGIFCQDGALVAIGSALIEDNSTLNDGSDPNESGNGGGVALYSGCTMFHNGVAGSSVGVRDNFAERNGGGYYVRNATLSLFGSAGGPSWVRGNEALVAGGGIAVNDAFGPDLSTVHINDSRVESNIAPRGGGIGVLAGGNVLMRRTLFGSTCHDDTRCSTLSLNGAPAEAGFCLGAALYASLGSAVDIRQTFIENNCINLHGHGVRVDENARVRVTSSVMARNSDTPFGIGSSFDGDLDLTWSTVARHFTTTQPVFIGLPTEATATGTVRLFGNILAEPFQQIHGTTVPSPMTVLADCLVVDIAFTQATAPIRAVGAASPWGMASPASGNYRLASNLTSVPVDFCDIGMAPRLGGDMNGVDDPVDQPRTNLFGPHDLGAYELTDEGADGVFANGFE